MISLRRIDESNFVDCFQLKLGDGHEQFVSSPIRSLAQAYVYREQCTPFGIYADDKMVGYVMVIYDYDEKSYNIWHMMIDREQQQKGYGKAALLLVMDYIRTKPFGPSDTMLLTCDPRNQAAYALYLGLGFRKTGQQDEDEVELGLAF